MMTSPIKRYRESRSLTQGQLAEILGVSDATITHIENGRRRITPEKAIEWESVIGITRQELCPDIFGAQSKKQKRRTKSAEKRAA